MYILGGCGEICTTLQKCLAVSTKTAYMQSPWPRHSMSIEPTEVHAWHSHCGTIQSVHNGTIMRPSTVECIIKPRHALQSVLCYAGILGSTSTSVRLPLPLVFTVWYQSLPWSPTTYPLLLLWVVDPVMSTLPCICAPVFLCLSWFPSSVPCAG